MALRSNGFRLTKRLDHFDKHRLEHPWVDQFEYEEDADEFLTKPLAAPVQECVRKKDRAIIRFDPTTCEFGILDTFGYIVTYYYRRKNGAAYFADQCK